MNILLVDDDTTIRYMIKSLLEKEGYHVIEATSGKDGISTIDSSHIDLIITDIVMPDMDGIEFIRNLRNDPTAEFKIIAMSGQGNIGDLGLDVALQLGVHTILTKPFQRSDLLKAIHALF